jgi:arsenite methyltransferase
MSSMAIHNIDENNVRDHTRRFQALDEAVRILKAGGRLVVADFWSRAYAQHLRDRRVLDVQQRSLGCGFWYVTILISTALGFRLSWHGRCTSLLNSVPVRYRH